MNPIAPGHTASAWESISYVPPLLVDIIDIVKNYKGAVMATTMVAHSVINCEGHSIWNYFQVIYKSKYKSTIVVLFSLYSQFIWRLVFGAQQYQCFLQTNNISE